MIYDLHVIWPDDHLPRSPENIRAKGAGFRRKTLRALIAKDNQILELQRKIRCLIAPKSPAKGKKEVRRW